MGSMTKDDEKEDTHKVYYKEPKGEACLLFFIHQIINQRKKFCSKQFWYVVALGN